MRRVFVVFSLLLVSSCHDRDEAGADLGVGDLADLAATTEDFAVGLDLLYSGIGFAPPPAFASDMGAPCWFSVAGALDVDGDGKLDIVGERNVALPSTLGWCHGDGGGGLAPMAQYAQQPSFNFSTKTGQELRVLDLDHRAPLDVLLTTKDCCHNTSPSNVFALNSFDANKFTVGDSIQSPYQGLGAPTYSVGVADFDEDGNLDYVAADEPVPAGDGNAMVRLGNGDGTFRDGTSLGVVMWATAGDFDGDHHADVLTCQLTWDSDMGYEYSGCALIRGDGHGGFGAAVPVTLPSMMGDQTGNRVADVDGDGRLDLVVSAPDHVAIDFGAGDGTFADSLTATFPSATSHGHDVQVADVDGDGKLELLAYGAGVSVYRVGRGDDGGAGGLQLVYRGPMITRGDKITLGDFDGDGRVDVATGDGIMLNTGRWP